MEGFATDGQYRRGEDQICRPATASASAPACESATVADVAKRKFATGSKQLGRSRTVAVQKQGTKLVVLAAEGKAQLAIWDAGQVLGDVGDVYLDASKRWVAIEFQTRFAGRTVDDLVVLPITLPATAAAPVQPIDVPAVDKKSSESPAFRKAVDDGIRWSRSRRTFAKAQTALNKALAEIPGHPEALYHLALLELKRKDTAATLATLAKLAASSHADKARWRVEARFDVRFKALRGDAAFREAVGISRKPGEQPSFYERLVALGGRWEQEAIPCEQPQVNLTLRRDAKQGFDLVIRSKCQGMAETTKLDGTWAGSENRKLALSFPNMESADDQLSCQIELCSDDSGEDCLRCQPDPELEFLLRVVRR